MGEIVGNIDHPTTIGGYLGLILLSITFVAIGVFASSLSKNQVIAFLLGLFFNFFIYFIHCCLCWESIRLLFNKTQYVRSFQCFTQGYY